MQIEIEGKMCFWSIKRTRSYFLLSSISLICCMTFEGGR